MAGKSYEVAGWFVQRKVWKKQWRTVPNRAPLFLFYSNFW